MAYARNPRGSGKLFASLPEVIAGLAACHEDAVDRIITIERLSRARNRATALRVAAENLCRWWQFSDGQDVYR